MIEFHCIVFLTVLLLMRQMRNAVAAGFDGIIVYNIESNARKNISFSHFPSINAFDGESLPNIVFTDGN